MNNHYDVIAISSKGSEFEQVLVDQNIRGYTVEMSRKITPILDLIALTKLWLIFLREHPYIVHTHTPKAGLLGMIAARMAAVPVRLHTVAGLPLVETTGFRKKLLIFLERLAYLCAHKVYPNSFNLKQLILNFKICKPEKLVVIGKGSSNGINTAYFDPSLYSDDFKTKLKIELEIENSFIFCYIGRIVKDKGIRELIEAFQILYTENESVRLLLIGNIEENNNLDEDTLFEIHNHRGIRFLNYKDDVRPFLSISDVFLFPSYREGFPNVILQACSMNVPCLVSNINGCNEIIQHNVNGRIVKPKSIESLIENMSKIVQNPDLLRTYKQNTRHRIVENYEQSYVWNEILKEYQSFK